MESSDAFEAFQTFLDLVLKHEVYAGMGLPPWVGLAQPGVVMPGFSTRVLHATMVKETGSQNPPLNYVALAAMDLAGAFAPMRLPDVGEAVLWLFIGEQEQATRRLLADSVATIKPVMLPGWGQA